MGDRVETQLRALSLVGRGPRRRRFPFGFTLVCCALVVASASPASAHGGGDYRWVQPLDADEAANGEALGRTAELFLGSGPPAMWTPDDQARVDFRGATFGPADRIEVSLQPGVLSMQDREVLGVDREAVNGNVIEVQVRNAGTGAPVALDDLGATLTLRTPYPVVSVHWSGAAGSWRQVPVLRTTGEHIVVALGDEGRWVALTDHVHGGGPSGLAVAAVGGVGLVYGLVRRRRATEDARQGASD